MGKITKKATDKHKVSLSPALVDFIQKTTTLPLAELRAHLASLPTRWPFPRGDLYNWIEPLDRFDSILQKFIEHYGLNVGPQTQPFSNAILTDGSPGVTEEKLQELGYNFDGDRALVETILSFSRLLLEKCGNRALYNSSDRLNDLLNTTSLSLLHSALRITVFLALRFSERTPNTAQQPHSQFYNYDHDRLNKIAAPLAPLTYHVPKRNLSTPAKSTKSKEKGVQSSKLRRVSTSVNPNDFKSLSRTDANSGAAVADFKPPSTPDPDWQQWANVKVTWMSVSTTSITSAADQLESQGSTQEMPATPTPFRRQSSMLSRTTTASSIADAGATASENPTIMEKTGANKIELTAADLMDTTIEQVLRNAPETMPSAARYDLLHKLRVAYGLINSNESRKSLLAIRLLGLAILGYIYDEHEFPQKVFGSDTNSSTKSQLVHQIVSLVQTGRKEQADVSLYLQTLAMEALGVLARQRTLAAEINAALAPNSSHGLLLSLTQKGLDDLHTDGDASDNEIGDDWREAVFSLLSAFMLHSIHSARSSETVIHPSLISIYASGLGIITGKALRVHLRILDFMKTFFHHFKDGLAVLSTNKAFDAACELLGNLSHSALDLLHQGHGMPDEFKTKVTDYQIPYMHQQVIRSMIDLVNDIIGHQGGHAERILRNLVDAQSLLNAFHSILSNIGAFGAHTWSEVVKAIVGFLHNEPTSYTIITEAGITKTLLEMVVPSKEHGAVDQPDAVSDVPSGLHLKIPPNGDAIVNLSQAFGAICLTNTGFDNFKTSGAIEKFFEIFESLEHVKAIKDANTLAMLGNTFDELVRHHPQLKPIVVSSAIVMMAKVRYICRVKGRTTGAGARLCPLGKENTVPGSGGAETFHEEFVPTPNTPSSPLQSWNSLKLPNGQTLNFTSISTTEPDAQSSLPLPATAEQNQVSMVDFARPAISFLLNFFENQTSCTYFMEQGATDIVLDFVTLPAISPDDQTFGREGIAHELASLVHMMAETKPHLVLPVLADRLRFICQTVLDDFAHQQPSNFTCYFEPFVKQSHSEEEMDIDGQQQSALIKSGTRTVKGLTAVFTMTTVLSEIFSMLIYNTRTTSTTTVFFQVHIADILSDICRKLGPIAAACYREEIALQRTIPESWLSATKPGGFSTGNEEVDKILNVSETPTDEAESNANSQAGPATQSHQPTPKDEQSALFRNVQTLRYLLIETPASISEFLQRVGRGIVMKKKLDGIAKHKSNIVAAAVAEAYMAQIQPYFLSETQSSDDTAKAKEDKFAYLLIALAYVRGSLHDDSPNHNANSARQSLVIDYFRKAGGMKRLTAIGNELFDELKSCKVEHSIFSANTGLKHCLDILDDFTSYQNICESNHGAWMKETNHNKPFVFNPAQLLLELRMDAMSLTRRIWDSEYADQASADVVQKLISILKHVFNGDHSNGDQELEAIQSIAQWPKLSLHQRRKFLINKDIVSRIAKDKQYPEDLVREAMYRSNCPGTSGTKAIEEYCDAVKSNPRRRRLPIPDDEVDLSSATSTTGVRSPAALTFPNPTAIINAATEGLVETLAEVVGSTTDNDLDNPDDELFDDAAPDTSNAVSATMNINNILNAPEALPSDPQKQVAQALPIPTYTVESMNAERESIRDELADRCNNILNNHQNLTFELSDLITSATKKLSEAATKAYWENTCSVLVLALLSRQAEDEMTEVLGKKIAAAAHLIALLIQDDAVFKSTLGTFQDNFDDLLSFLKLSPVQTQNADDSASPWVAPILLILERMLSLDAEPAQCKWDSPSDMESAASPKLTYNPVFSLSQKTEVFDLLTALLPRVGKDKSMALSIIRVLVILTRARELATLQGHRSNLQRLFLMVKQLGGGTAGRFHNSFMLVLRHIIEDDDTLRQIMRSEIKANLLAHSTSRSPDLTAYIRGNYHLALRSPEIFVEVSNELIKLDGWSHQPQNSPLKLKEDVLLSKQSNNEGGSSQGGREIIGEPAASIEGANDETTLPEKTKAPEIKAPVVEHPDGVIHFLLSELLAYKEVEDKEPVKAVELQPQVPNGTRVEDSREPASPDASSDAGISAVEKPEKAKFKADDHPIFLYRSFILHCLTELLHSYNRTKIEFMHFSRKADPMAVTPSKPRASILNYLLNSMVSSGYVDKDDTIICKKKMALSEWAVKVIVALCSKTGEAGLGSPAQRYSSQGQVDDQDTEPDLTFVRRFVLEHAIKAFKDAISSTETVVSKYSRLLCLSALFYRLLSKPTGPDGAAGSHNNSYKMLGRMMFEKNLISVLTSSLADIDLSFPSARKVIKFILRPLQDLTHLAAQLSLTSPEIITSVMGNDIEDIISSASSVSEMDDFREETPDLFRNSALGMLDPSHQTESDTSEDEDEDEEMYDEDYDDEMEYDEGLAVPNDGEVISDEEIEEGMEDVGPIEGLPGDVQMGIEFVVNGPNIHTDEDDEDDDISIDEDDDDDDEDDDIEIEMDDDEINADDENDSLGEGHDEGEWEDEDEDDNEEDDDEDENEEGEDIQGDVSFEADDLNAPVDLGTASATHNELSTLLRALGEQDLDGHIMPPPPQLIVHDDHVQQSQDDEDDEDDGEEGDDMDENDGIDYDDGLNFMADGLDDFDNEQGWDSWGEPPGSFFRRHRNALGMGRHGMPNFINRRIHTLGDHHDLPHQILGRHRHAATSRSAGDDGLNPLLQRSENTHATRSGMDGPAFAFGQPNILTLPSFGRGIGETGRLQLSLPMDFNLNIDNPNISSIGAHGAVLDAIVQALQNGDRNILQSGPFPTGGVQVHVNAPEEEMRQVMRSMGVNQPPRHTREDPSRAASFVPSMTTTRWQEEARMLFGSTFISKIQHIQLLLLSKLVPSAQTEEKDRRRKEEERRKREAEELEKRKQEEERLQREKEEREAAEKAAAEAEAKAKAEAEAAAAVIAAAAAAEASTHGASTVGAEPMEGVLSSENINADPAATSEAVPAATEPARIFTTIRGRQLDITGLAIDHDYLEALPEDLREEVIMQQYTERRENAQEGADDTIDPDFLDALPDDIREEIRQHELHTQRRRQREEARRQAQQASGASAGIIQAEDMDNDNFFATLDPALRRAILAEQPAHILAGLDPRHAAEGRAQQRGLYINRMNDPRAPRPDDRARRDGAAKDNKRQVVQLIDKAGVATLLRLMFLPLHGSLKSHLWNILANVCGNRQTRFEVISLLLIILREGSTDVAAVERSLASLSLRAKASAAQKTPQPLKRTLSMQPQATLGDDITPMTVVQQCLTALQQLCRSGFNVKTIFLREVDVSAHKSTKKGKAKDNKTTKYPINDLINLLDRKLIMDSSSCLQALAELLASVTSPLQFLMKKEKEESTDKVKETQDVEQVANQQNIQATPNAAQDSTREDTPMVEAPSTSQEVAAADIEGQDTAVEGEAKTDDAGQEEKRKPFEPPVISEHNLKLVTSVFVAPECHNDIFHSTLETLSSLSFIPGTSAIFSRELVSHVQALSQAICGDLGDLLPLIKEAQSTSDLQGITSAKFSAGSSDQVKLLRVLQALDYLSAPKKENDVEDESATVKSILNSSYETLSLGPLWNKLSDCLTAVREKGDTIGFANILLPLIESLMVVCKNTPLKDAPIAVQSQDTSLASPSPEGMNDLEGLFFKFTTEHRKILNDIVRQNPKLMQGNGNFSLLVKNSKVLDFDNKRNYFTKQIHSRHHQRHVQPPLQLSVRREHVFLDSFKNLYFKSADEMKHGKLNIRFLGEEGVDAGGVTREWFQVLARGMFDPNYALFSPMASDRTTFHPNPLSNINDQHLLYFKFIGRIIGKALHEGRVLDCHFSRAVYKRILGKSPNLKDLESNDVDYYKSLTWILENDITDILTEEFCVIENIFGEDKVIDLIPGGRDISVTEENKREYVQKLVEYRLTTSVKDQLDNFLQGFHDIIPAELIAIFNEQELELLISGLPEIDVDDWKANTEYHNYSPSSPQIVWFWRIVRGMTNEERAKLLQFITGTSKVPLNGFKELEGVSGLTKHNIHKDPSTHRLPTSHTCFNQLDLPAYESFELMKQNLTTAINLGADYFGFA